jgi:hypothetical protein
MFGQEIVNERDNLKDLGVGGRVILQEGKGKIVPVLN